MKRVCQLDGCELPVDGLRRDAKYCGPAHKQEAYRRRHAVGGHGGWLGFPWRLLGRARRHRPVTRSEA